MIPALILAAARDRLADSALTPSIDPLDLGSTDQVSWVWETVVKERWPRDGGLAWKEWAGLYGSQAGELIERGRCLLAIVQSSTPVFLGFVLLDGQGRLRMLYVKSSYRGHGLGLTLLEAAGTSYPVRVVAPNKCWKRWTDVNGLESTAVSVAEARQAA